MSEIPKAPLDAITGIPLPIIPLEPDVRSGGDIWTDYHHTFYNRNNPELEDPAGKALRYSRGQAIPRWLHTAYHETFAPPDLPSSVDEKFRLTVMACANMVGPLAIDFTQADPTVPVVMTRQQHADIVNPNSMHFEYAHHAKRAGRRRDDIGRFFASYVLETDLQECADIGMIEEFIDTTDTERQAALRGIILENAIELSIEPIIPVASEVMQEAPASMNLASPAEKLRTTVGTFFMERCYFGYHDPLVERAKSTLQLV